MVEIYVIVSFLVDLFEGLIPVIPTFPTIVIKFEIIYTKPSQIIHLTFLRYTVC